MRRHQHHPLLVSSTSQLLQPNYFIMVSTFTPPKSYKAYAFTKVGGDLEPVTVPWKDPEHGEVVLKVLACGICARSASYSNSSLSTSY